MKFLTEKRFSFVSAGLAPDTFGVVHFTGTEAISSLYEFNITLVTDNSGLDLDTILSGTATFTIHRPNDQHVDFTGILSQFEQLHAFDDCIFYRAQLRPRLWWLTLTHHNQVHLKLPVAPSSEGAAQQSLIGRTLIDGGLTALDFDFRNQKSYSPQEYVCQYNESHFAFFSRWLEREGLYYFFEQKNSVEKVVITDSMVSQIDFPQQGNLIYSPPSGLDQQHQDEVIKSLICRQKMLPKKVLFRDHNYERPTLEVAGTAMVDPLGRGESYVYGDYFLTPEEGNRLAKIYAESLLCRKREFIGESTVPFMMPGYTFSLKNHYRADFNRKYLVSEVHHEGNQTGYLISGLQGALTEVEKGISYRNSFVAIPAEVQYRAERVTAKPRISGTLHAMVDAEGSGEYAELDDQGRYKVRLPFDINDKHGAGKASCYLRMAQPYAGPKRGMHFPLPKGTEVLLTFIDGDPDRPVIASAVPTPETQSPSTAINQTESVIRTGGDNKIRIEDRKGSERILMWSPTSDSWMHLGAHIHTPQGPIAHLPPGTIPQPPASGRRPGHGVRIHTREDLWIESCERYGEYRCGVNPRAPKGSTAGDEPKSGTLLDNFNENYVPTGILGRHSQSEQSWQDVLANSHIHVSSLDTVTTQEGNIYDFGGYWNYNLGNCYIENHIKQITKLNDSDLAHDLLNAGGPNFSTVNFPTLKDGADASLSGSWPPSDGMWVEKKVGNSYDYLKGDAIGVVVGSSLDIAHGGRHVEVKYRGDGSLAAWSKLEGGVSHEKKWTKKGTLILETSADSNSATSSETVYDRNLGSFASYSTKANSGGGLASFSFTMSAKSTADINLAAVAAFSLHVGPTVFIDISAAAKAGISISAAAKAEIDISAAFSATIEGSTSAWVKMDIGSKKVDFKTTGMELSKDAALKAKKAELRLESIEAQLETHSFCLTQSGFDLENLDLLVQSGLAFIGL